MKRVLSKVARISEQRVEKPFAKPVIHFQERTVEVPHSLVVEEITEVPIAARCEMMKQVAKVEVQQVERQVEKPTVQLMERLEEVPQVEVRENIIEAMLHSCLEVYDIY